MTVTFGDTRGGAESEAEATGVRGEPPAALPTAPAARPGRSGISHPWENLESRAIPLSWTPSEPTPSASVGACAGTFLTSPGTRSTVLQRDRIIEVSGGSGNGSDHGARPADQIFQSKSHMGQGSRISSFFPNLDAGQCTERPVYPFGTCVDDVYQH